MQIYFKELFQNKESEWKYIYITPRPVTIDTSLRIFQYKLLNNVLYLNEKLFKFKIVSSPLCSFCNSEMKPLYYFFTVAIMQNLFDLNSKSYWTQKYFFHKIPHGVLSLVFQIIKKILKSLTICMLYIHIDW